MTIGRWKSRCGEVGHVCWPWCTKRCSQSQSPRRTGMMRIFRKYSDCIVASWYKLCNNVCLPSRFFVRKVVIWIWMCTAYSRDKQGIDSENIKTVRFPSATSRLSSLVLKIHFWLRYIFLRKGTVKDPYLLRPRNRYYHESPLTREP